MAWDDLSWRGAGEVGAARCSVQGGSREVGKTAALGGRRGGARARTPRVTGAAPRRFIVGRGRVAVSEEDGGSQAPFLYGEEDSDMRRTTPSAARNGTGPAWAPAGPGRGWASGCLRASTG